MIDIFKLILNIFLDWIPRTLDHRQPFLKPLLRIIKELYKMVGAVHLHQYCMKLATALQSLFVIDFTVASMIGRYILNISAFIPVITREVEHYFICIFVTYIFSFINCQLMSNNFLLVIVFSLLICNHLHRSHSSIHSQVPTPIHRYLLPAPVAYPVLWVGQNS